MQKHAKPVYHFVAARLGRFQQIRHQGHVDDIGDGGFLRQRAQRDIKRRLALHAE